MSARARMGPTPPITGVRCGMAGKSSAARKSTAESGDLPLHRQHTADTPRTCMLTSGARGT